MTVSRYTYLQDLIPRVGCKATPHLSHTALFGPCLGQIQHTKCHWRRVHQSNRSTITSESLSWLLAHLPAGVLGADLLHGPGRDDVEALHHNCLGQQRGQVLCVGLGVLVHPPVVAHVHQDLPWWTAWESVQHVSWQSMDGASLQ